MSAVIPLTTFADYIGRQVKLVMTDGTERFEQIEGVETTTVIVWPGGSPDHIPQQDIDQMYSIGGHLVAVKEDKMSIPAQNSLNNFYQSVAYRDQRLATLMSEDVEIVAIHGLGADKSGGQEAANRLREKSRDLPEVLRRVLESALTELGYE